MGRRDRKRKKKSGEMDIGRKKKRREMVGGNESLRIFR